MATLRIAAMLALLAAGLGAAVFLGLFVRVGSDGVCANPLGRVLFSQPSTSMAPTIAAGDVFLVECAGGSGERPPIHGDIVVFAGRDGRTLYVKRIAAIGGDRIALRDSVVVLNGADLARRSLGPVAAGSRAPRAGFRESVAEDCAYDIVERPSGEAASAVLNDVVEMIVPDGHVFVLGDNRDNSLDSRLAQIGFVPVEAVLGRATRVIYSTPPGAWAPSLARSGAHLDCRGRG